MVSGPSIQLLQCVRLRGWTSCGCVIPLLHAVAANNKHHQGAKCFIAPPTPSFNISFSYIALSFSAIYNYDARGEEELSLQIGDTVHILETYERERWLTDDICDPSWRANVEHVVM